MAPREVPKRTQNKRRKLENMDSKSGSTPEDGQNMVENSLEEGLKKQKNSIKRPNTEGEQKRKRNVGSFSVDRPPMDHKT